MDFLILHSFQIALQLKILKAMNEKKTTFSVRFWMRHTRTQGNVSPLFCRVTICGQRYEINTNYCAPLKGWDAKLQRWAGRNAEEKDANRVIRDYRIKVDDALERLRRKNAPVNLQNFKIAFNDDRNDYSTIKALFEYHRIIDGKNLTDSTMLLYEVTERLLLRFVRIRFRLSDIKVEAIDKAFVMEFYAYLQGFKREGAARVCTVNGAMKHIQRLKRVLNLALQNDWLASNPVCALHVKRNKVERGYLEAEEVERLKNCVLPPSLSVLRDMFLFAVYTGISYVDMVNLTGKNIVVGIDRTRWLQFHRQKTGLRVSLPLLPPAEKILEGFECYAPAGGEERRIFPMLSNQATNRYLKDIARIAGIRKNITFHLARHTFATTITLQQGIPIETVSKMLGHASLTTTQIYAKVLDKKVMDDMSGLRDLYSEKKPARKTAEQS